MPAFALQQVRCGLPVRTITGRDLGRIVRVIPCAEVVGCGYATDWQLEPCPGLLLELDPGQREPDQPRHLPLAAVRAVTGGAVLVADPLSEHVWRCPGQQVLRHAPDVHPG